MQCKAKSKRTGERCQAPAVTGKEVCYHHGGKSKSGTEVGTFKHGRHSKRLPKRLHEQYAAALADPNLTSLREDIAVLDALISEQIARLSEDSPAELWGEARIAVDSALKALSNGESATCAVVLEQMQSLFERSAGVRQAENRLLTFWEQRRKLSDSETRRDVALSAAFAEQAMVMLAYVREAIEAEVSDPATRSKIQRALRVLDGGAASGHAGDRGAGGAA